MKFRIPTLLVVDHASNFIPEIYNSLGLKKSLINSHIAYDVNILKISKKIGSLLDATVISAQYSRLIIDLNRGIEDPTLIPSISDKKIIPGNVLITKSNRAKRIKKIYNNYHLSIEELIRIKKIKLIISMHSFNPVFKNNIRKVEIGILSNKDRRYSDLLIKNIKNKGFHIGDNDPYKGDLINDTMYKHGLKNNILHTLIEIRNDLINSEKKINKISNFIVKSIKDIEKEASKFL